MLAIGQAVCVAKDTAAEALMLHTSDHIEDRGPRHGLILLTVLKIAPDLSWIPVLAAGLYGADAAFSNAVIHPRAASFRDV